MGSTGSSMRQGDDSLPVWKPYVSFFLLPFPPCLILLLLLTKLLAANHNSLTGSLADDLAALKSGAEVCDHYYHYHTTLPLPYLS